MSMPCAPSAPDVTLHWAPALAWAAGGRSHVRLARSRPGDGPGSDSLGRSVRAARGPAARAPERADRRLDARVAPCAQLAGSSDSGRAAPTPGQSDDARVV